jgi:hypothetical protein
MNTLFSDLKTDEEKSAFFLSGRGYETGIIAAAIQNDVAMAYHRCAEYKKELAALQAECEKYAESLRAVSGQRLAEIKAMAVMDAIDAHKNNLLTFDFDTAIRVTDLIRYANQLRQAAKAGE